jgi:cytochrome c-type biogenesis protein CcmH
MAGAATARAQDDGPTPPPREVTDDEVNRIAEQLYCPVCENVPLDVCGTQACADWRDEIRAMLEEGRSEADIKAYFVDRYGQRVLATPEARGINVFVWIAPILALIGGGVVLVVALRRMAPTSLTGAVQSGAKVRYDDLDPEYVARLERDLDEYAS